MLMSNMMKITIFIQNEILSQDKLTVGIEICHAHQSLLYRLGTDDSVTIHLRNINRRAMCVW